MMNVNKNTNNDSNEGTSTSTETNAPVSQEPPPKRFKHLSLVCEMLQLEECEDSKAEELTKEELEIQKVGRGNFGRN